MSGLRRLARPRGHLLALLIRHLADDQRPVAHLLLHVEELLLAPRLLALALRLGAAALGPLFGGHHRPPRPRGRRRGGDVAGRSVCRAGAEKPPPVNSACRSSAAAIRPTSCASCW